VKISLRTVVLGSPLLVSLLSLTIHAATAKKSPLQVWSPRMRSVRAAVLGSVSRWRVADGVGLRGRCRHTSLPH
jgi:hypothetical protein